MTPNSFRDLSQGEQVEMMAHRREVLLRKAHAESVSQIVGKLDDPNEPKDKKPGRGR